MINWFDIETTGLDPESNVLLEVGCIITDDKLNEVARLALCIEPPRPWLGPTLGVDGLIEMSGPFVRQMHTDSGLWEELRSGRGWPLRDAEDGMMAVVSKWSGDQKHLLAGSSVHFDRAWLKVHMPRLEALFNYRNLDVSTLKEAYRLFGPAGDVFLKSGGHRALVDLDASIAELKHYLNLMGWDGDDA